MFRGVVVAACSILFAGLSAATAGEWHRHHAAWYDQEPWIGTGVGYYYSQHPDHIPAYPKRLTGYAVPIYDPARPVLWTQAALKRRLELFDPAGFYA